jgi:diguanylate cyclase (GGDEF)-like protein
MKLLWSDLLQTTFFKGEALQPLFWQMLDELFAPWPHVLATAGLVLTAVFILSESGSPYAGLGALVALAHFAFRWAGAVWYYQRAKRQNPRFWMNIFILSALTSGTAWGASIMLLLHGAPTSGRYLILTVACAIVQSATARAFMAPLPLIGQTFILILQIVGISLYQGDWIIAPAAIVFASFQLGHMRSLIHLRLRQLQTETEKDTLLKQIARTNEDLRTANEMLHRTAMTDGLTGLSNRRALDRHMQMNDPRRNRTLLPYSVILFDVDHFKRFNDSHGHQAGDTCLEAIGAELRALPFPQGHLIARYGGEEFVVILPHTDGPAALTLAESIREKLAAIEISVSGTFARITVSLGVASLAAAATDDPSRLLTRADTALYRAKLLGRNRVEHEDPAVTSA